MFAYGRYIHITKLRHSPLRAPDTFITVHNLRTVLLSLNLKNQELRRTISYLKLLRYIVFIIY